MCTAIRYGNLFGRNFDLDIEYEQNLIFVPRNYALKLRHRKGLLRHYAFMGMGFCVNDFALCYDGVNEKGLACASLNFPEFAEYKEPRSSKENIASFELIPYVLSKCQNTKEAIALIKRSNITNTAFSQDYPPSPLHWMVADKESSIVIEVSGQGMKIHQNKADVLTNSPSFDMQILNLSNYMTLSNKPAKNSFSKKLKLSTYSFGMSAIGLPGDTSSMSRFVKAAFLLHNSPEISEKEEKVSHFFRLLYSVSMVKGAVLTESGKHEFTQYSCCIDLDNIEYRYTSYRELTPKTFSLKNADREGQNITVL